MCVFSTAAESRGETTEPAGAVHCAEEKESPPPPFFPPHARHHHRPHLLVTSSSPPPLSFSLSIPSTPARRIYGFQK
ncbi:unnamed protein product [Urochloa humidicola]